MRVRCHTIIPVATATRMFDWIVKYENSRRTDSTRAGFGPPVSMTVCPERMTTSWRTTATTATTKVTVCQDRPTRSRVMARV